MGGMTSNLPFIAVNVLVGVMLAWSLVIGIQNRQTVGGKIAMGLAGTCLLLQGAFLSLVAIIAISAKAGHPF